MQPLSKQKLRKGAESGKKAGDGQRLTIDSNLLVQLRHGMICALFRDVSGRLGKHATFLQLNAASCIKGATHSRAFPAFFYLRMNNI